MGNLTKRQRTDKNIQLGALLQRVQAFGLQRPDPYAPTKLVAGAGGLANEGDGETVRCDASDPDALPCHMTADQLRACLALINKRLPDLRSIEVAVVDKVSDMNQLTTLELQALAQGHMIERLDESVVSNQ
jgi:hypothetical protein